jgi:hypothetical protein
MSPFFFPSVVVWIELWASRLLGRHSYQLSHCTSPFYVGFETGSHFMTRLAWTTIFLMCVSLCNQDDRCVPLRLAICWDGVLKTFCPGRPQNTILWSSASQVARITGLSHHTQPLYVILKSEHSDTGGFMTYSSVLPVVLLLTIIYSYVEF